MWPSFTTFSAADKEITFSYFCYLFGLFSIISAAMMPGIQPARDRIQTITNEPQPLSTTARGGQIIARRTLNKDIE